MYILLILSTIQDFQTTRRVANNTFAKYFNEIVHHVHHDVMTRYLNEIDENIITLKYSLKNIFNLKKPISLLI